MKSPTQRHEGAKAQNICVFSLRLRLVAVLSPNFVVFREDSPGARTALSASSTQRPSNTRTSLSALLWLRLRRAMPLRENETMSAGEW